MNIAFDKEKHQYTDIDTGSILPSVSQVLKGGGCMPAFYNRLPERYAKIGTLTHSACQFDDEGDLDETTIDPVIKPKLDAYRQWKKAEKVTVIANELLVYHEPLWYAGTLDKTVEIDGQVWILDIKGETPVAYHAIQTMAYKMAFMEMFPSDKHENLKRAALYLKKTGVYRFEIHNNDVADRNAFLNAMTVYSQEEEKAEQEVP